MRAKIFCFCVLSMFLIFGLVVCHSPYSFSGKNDENNLVKCAVITVIGLCVYSFADDYASCCNHRVPAI